MESPAINGATVAVAGGSGFIGSAIVRHLLAGTEMRVRVLTRSPERAAQRRPDLVRAEFVRADVTDAASLPAALAGANAIVNAAQFDGYPVENPRRGLTFERIDYAGTAALVKAALEAGAERFIYVSGAAADEHSPHPGFRAKGRAERVIRESGLAYTIFRPSLVYGPQDRVTNLLAAALRFAPVFGVPGSGRQKVQPVLVDDVARCVVAALSGRGRNGTFELGGPEVMTFDEFVRLIMEITGRRRPLVHIPEPLMRAAGLCGEMMPRPLFSRDAVTFVVADNVCEVRPLLAEFGIALTPPRDGMAYLRRA